MARSGVASKPWKEDPGKYASTVYFRIQAKRKSYAFAIRVLFWMFLLSLIAFGEMGLVFAVVAFQIIIGDALPAVPYLTIVYKYNLTVFIFIILITIEALLVGWREDGIADWCEELDQWFCICFFVVYVVFHSIGVVYVRSKVEQENDKIGQTIEATQDLQPIFMTVFACTESAKKTNYGARSMG
eukprot:326024_1